MGLASSAIIMGISTLLHILYWNIDYVILSQ
jgi:O-antigen/teichoic acid export membrane protein